MKMADDDIDLELYFAAARRQGAVLPDDLAARMLQDAETVQARLAAPAPVVAPPGLIAQLREALGGWYGIGGLAAACAAGIWLGAAPPSVLPDPVALVIGSVTPVPDLFDGESLALALSEDG